MAAYAHCKIISNTINVVIKFGSLAVPMPDIDFVTGDLGSFIKRGDKSFNLGTTVGTTLNANAVTNDTTFTVVSTTNINQDERVVIELNNGNRHWVVPDNIISGTQFSVYSVFALTSNADSGNNVASITQLDGTTNGTTLSVAASSPDTTFTVVSTTGFSVDEPVRITLNDDRKQQWVTPDNIISGTQFSVYPQYEIRSAAAIGNAVVSLTQLTGTTDGTVDDGFKASKISRIQKTTTKLLQYGAFHQGLEFDATKETIALLGGIESSDIVTGTFFLNSIDGIPYDFTSPADFDTCQDSIVTRYRNITNNNLGETALLNSVAVADDTQVAMDAIIDLRI